MTQIYDMKYFERAGKDDIAYIHSQASGKEKQPYTVMFCGGFKSDMRGGKAEFIEAQCQEAGIEFLRFDYSGHGDSKGEFADGTIGQWAQDAMDLIEYLDLRNIILIGSSMGGWISFLIARAMPDRVAAMIGIAAAPDFTDDLYYNSLTEDQRQIIEREGRIDIPNDYSDEPYIFTKALIEDGRKNFILEGQKAITFDFPIHLLQGKLDTSVPWKRAEEIKAAMTRPDVKITYIDDGDHRLSRDQDLALIWETVGKMASLI